MLKKKKTHQTTPASNTKRTGTSENGERMMPGQNRIIGRKRCPRILKKPECACARPKKRKKSASERQKK